MHLIMQQVHVESASVYSDAVADSSVEHLVQAMVLAMLMCMVRCHFLQKLTGHNELGMYNALFETFGTAAGW